MTTTKKCPHCGKEVVPIQQAVTDMQGGYFYEEECPKCGGIISEGN